MHSVYLNKEDKQRKGNLQEIERAIKPIFYPQHLQTTKT